jgi:hypothetical protein
MDVETSSNEEPDEVIPQVRFCEGGSISSGMSSLYSTF